MQVPKDHVIFQQGDEGSTFYIIDIGAVKVLVLDERLSASGAPNRYGSCVCVLEDGDSFALEAAVSSLDKTY